MIRAIVLLLCGMIGGCASEWHTGEKVTPSTYEAASFRSSDSVGKLSRLAVMQVEVHIADDTEKTTQLPNPQSVQLGRELQANIVSFLTTEKGYDAIAIAIATQAPPPDAATIRETGMHLGVDGIVVAERWIAKPWPTSKAVLNVFMLNLPLFNAMSALNLRISIYETASGRLVWRQELKGEETSASVDLSRALGDLENAVPRQLRR